MESNEKEMYLFVKYLIKFSCHGIEHVNVLITREHHKQYANIPNQYSTFLIKMF